jgi:hypothetical protein
VGAPFFNNAEVLDVIKKHKVLTKIYLDLVKWLYMWYHGSITSGLEHRQANRYINKAKPT